MCDHQWNITPPRRIRKETDVKNMNGKQATSKGTLHTLHSTNTCAKCNAWRGELGNEPTPTMFVQHIVEIFREVKRVMRDDGTLWFNIGDSYNNNNGFSRATDNFKRVAGKNGSENKKAIDGLKFKDLVGIPWMIAFALRDDGWYLRNDIIWDKKNCMPESVKDRCTRSHEYIFLLTKKSKYFFDHIAIQETVAPATLVRANSANNASMRKDAGNADQQGGLTPEQQNKYYGSINEQSTRNKRTVWKMATATSGGEHFATFPHELPLNAINAGTSAHGSCAQCGAPWQRVFDQKKSFQSGSGKSGKPIKGKHGNKLQGGGTTGDIRKGPTTTTTTTTTGWQPMCKCNADVVPCIVMDPFCGSGTTIDVAVKKGMHYIGIELNEQYVINEIMPKLAKTEGLFSNLTIER